MKEGKSSVLVLLDVALLLSVVILVDRVNCTFGFRDCLLAFSLGLCISFLDLLGLSLSPVTVMLGGMDWCIEVCDQRNYTKPNAKSRWKAAL